MIRITQCKIPCGSGKDALFQKIRRLLRFDQRQWSACSCTIRKHAVDARRKPELYDVYTVDVRTGLPEAEEHKLVRRLRSDKIRIHTETEYKFPESGSEKLSHRPIVIGAGPAGLFCALLLAEHGYEPLLLERGKAMEERIRDVERFWKEGILSPDSNVQFGEGGAGTFSDGKLNTQVKDPSGRIRKVLELFVQAGAPEDILYENLPHIGTDRLREVVPALRRRICEAGGEVRFDSCVTGFEIRDGALQAVIVGGTQRIETEAVILAPGHSARDTVRTLLACGVPMQAKNFAVGMRVSHPQRMIDENQYGCSDRKEMQRLGLVPASYKLTAQASSGRGVYTFCMCPGGYVVNASSEPGSLAVNGMSDLARDSGRANSAVVITVGPEDFGGEDVLDGLLFQEQLEQKAFVMGKGKIPVEAYEDFKQENDIPSGREITSEMLCVKGEILEAPLHRLLPEELTQAFKEGMTAFGRRIDGFDGEEAYVLGLESRTSSPVRIMRNEMSESAVRGLYPCGEGAGYAGGITSAAVDGLRIAEAIAKRYAPIHPSRRRDGS